jgi:transposase InsO family protein
MVSPQAKRQCVRYLVAQKAYSERSACRLVGIARSSHRYQQRAAADATDLRAKIHQVANENKAYGYRLVTAKIRTQGWLVNHKRVHRLWKEEGLQQKASHVNHVWSYDFMEDRTEKGQTLRILTVLDEYTRESLAIHVARSIPALDVVQLLEWLFLVRGTPAGRFTSRLVVPGKIRLSRVLTLL